MEISNIASGCLLCSHEKNQSTLQNHAGSNKVTSELLPTKSHNTASRKHWKEISLKQMKENIPLHSQQRNLLLQEVTEVDSAGGPDVRLGR